MDRNQIKELLPIIQAFSEGKTIQSRCIKGDKSLWYDDDDFSFDDDLEYRIKPETTYRPFKDVEECWQEMLKHKPFGWVKETLCNAFHIIDNVAFGKAHTTCTWYTLDSMKKNFTFADGQPFGIKCEED